MCGNVNSELISANGGNCEMQNENTTHPLGTSFIIHAKYNSSTSRSGVAGVLFAYIASWFMYAEDTHLNTLTSKFDMGCFPQSEEVFTIQIYFTIFTFFYLWYHTIQITAVFVGTMTSVTFNVIIIMIRDLNFTYLQIPNCWDTIIADITTNIHEVYMYTIHVLYHTLVIIYLQQHKWN